MKKDTTLVIFFLLLTLPLILLCSQTYAQDKHDHKPSDPALVRSNIVGKVTDAQGHPIEKVKVTVLDPDTREVLARGVTNEQGEYVIECLDPRQYYLALSALPERFVGQTVVVNLGKNGQIVQWAVNPETPAIATTRVGGGVCGCGTGWLSKNDDDKQRVISRSNIVGKVVDAQGNPIEKVKVTVFDLDKQEIIARRITDEEGNYAIECLDQQKYNLVLSTLTEQFLGRDAVVDLGKNGLDVHWVANQQTPDIDSTTNGGVCSCAAGWLSNGSQAGVSLVASLFGTTPGILGTVGVVVGGGVTLGVLLDGRDSGGSHDSPPPPPPPPPASPSR